MKKITSFITAACLMILSLGAYASATTYYISPTGSDSNSGNSTSNPWKTFAYALPELVPGDTLYLMDGNYTSSTTGLPSINIAYSVNNGTASEPITVQAQNERKALLQSSSDNPAFYLKSASYWVIDGIHFQGGDNTYSAAAQFQVERSDHIILRRLLGQYNNRYANNHLLQLAYTYDSLVEESEFYNFHRHAIMNFLSYSNTFRRNYINSRNTSDVPGGFDSGDVGEPLTEQMGDEGIAFYPAWDNLAENNIAETVIEGFTAHGTGTDTHYSSGNRHFGNIALNTEYGGFYQDGRSGHVVADTQYINNIVVSSNPYSGVAMGMNFADVLNTSIDTQTIILTPPPATDVYGVYNTKPKSTTASVFYTNALVQTNAGIAYYSSGLTDWSFDYTDSFGASTAWSPDDGHVTNSMQVDPQLGTCMVWIPESSPMKGAGKNGSDIGANILYRYENGVLTDEPLWNTTTGEFPCGAIVPGVNDVAGESCFDVHNRLNVNKNGCLFPSGYAAAGPSISLNSPSDYLFTNNATIAFNCSATSSSNLTNMTLYGNWSGWSAKNSTNMTGTSNSSQWINDLSDGSYIWNCLIYDDTGNSSFAVNNYTFTIDTIPPQAITGLANQSQNDRWIYWNWSNPVDPDFNHTEVWLNGTFKTNTSGNSYNATGLLVNSTYQIQTRTTDNAGNINTTWVNSTAMTLPDTYPPSIAITSPQNSTYSIHWLWANVTLDEAGSWCSVSLNSTANQTMSNASATAWYLNLTVPGEGSNNIKFYCNDTFDNMGNSSLIYFTIDTTPPVSITALTNQSRSDTWLYWNWTNPTDADFNHTEVWLNGTFKTNTSANSYNATGLEASAFYEIQTRTVDDIGNINTTWINATATTLVDMTPPQITFVSPTPDDNENRTQTWAYINISLNENGSISLIEWNNGTSSNYTMSGSGTNFYLNMTDQNGTITYKIYVNDTIGNTGISGLRTVTLNYSSTSTPPSISLIPLTLPNSSTTANNWAYINATVTDLETPNNLTAFIDWNRSLIGWWRFNQESDENSTFFRDWSSYRNNATCSGTTCPASANGSFGKALQFDGSNDYLDAGNQGNVTGALTIIAWVKRGTNSAWRTIISKGESVNEYDHNYVLWVSTTNTLLIGFGQNDGSTYRSFETTSTIDTNWHHIVAIINTSTNMKIYIDRISQGGTYAGSATTLTPNTKKLLIGSSSTTTERFIGTIDEVQLWNRILSPEEINASYNTGSYRLYHNFTGLAEGTYTYTAYAQDLAGNVSDTSTRTLYVNYSYVPETSLSITIVSPLNQSYSSRNVWANISLSVAGAWCGVSLNDTANQTLSNTSQTGWYLNLSIPSEGSNNVRFWCNDTASNTSNSSTTYFTIDTISPTVTINTPQNNAILNNVPYINGTVTENNLATIKTNSTYYTAIDSTSPFNFTNTSTIPDGTYTINVSANDSAGNVGWANVTFTKDTLKPIITVQFPANNSNYSMTSMDFNITINEIVSWAGYSLDGAANTTLTNTTGRWWNTTTLSEGLHNVTFYANDTAGNMNTTGHYYFRLDTTAPTPTIISPANITYSTNPQLNFSYTELNPSTCKYSLNAASNVTLASCNTNGTTLTSNYGSNNVILYMNDTAGNTNSTQKYWTYDNKSPQYTNNLTSLSSPQTYSPALSIQFNITATDQYSSPDTVLLEFNNTNYTTINISSTYTKTLSNLAAGTYNYRWHMNDTLGNRNSTAIMQYTITKATTTLTLLLNGTDSDNSYYTPASVNGTFTKDNNEVTVSMYRNGTQLELTDNTNITRYESAGDWNYSISTSGSQNYSAASASHIVTILLTLGPNITAWSNNITNTPSTSVTMNETQSIFFNITVDQSVNYSWSLDNIDQSRNAPNYTYSNSEPGTRSVKANISNINGTGEMTWTITVKDMPNINSVQESSDPVSVGSIVSIEANITDLDGDLSGKYIVIEGTWYEMQPNGQDMYLANYTPATEKVYYYYIFANDTTGLFANTTTYTFTSQQGPAITNVTVTPSSGNETTNFVIQANITDLNSISTAFAKFTQPAVFQIDLNNVTDIYNTTYNSTTPGLYVFYVWANDTTGAYSSSTTYSFTINDTIPPLINSVTITPPQKNETTVITISANVTDFNVSAVYANITGPENAIRMLTGTNPYTNTTGTIPHKPGFYNMEITATDASGNKATFTTNYTVNDTQVPSLNLLSVMPLIGSIGTSFTIIANITDNDAVNSTRANITKPGDGYDILSLASPNPYSASFTNTSWLGLYIVSVIANDSAGNTLYSFSYPLGIANFSIDDSELPSINELNVTPASVNTTQTVTITANVTDDNAVSFVTARVTRPDSFQIPVASFTNVSDIYTANYTETTIPGLYTVTLNATDIAGNVSTAAANFTAVDTISPQVTLFAVDDSTPSAGQKITFTATSSDNDIISKVTGTINITKPDNISELITMAETGSSNQGSPPASVIVQQEGNYTATLVGNYTALLTISDSANNTALSAMTFEAFDATGPSVSTIAITAIESENITVNITTDEAANYTFAYDAGTGWNYATNSTLRLNHTITLPEYNANTTILYYINLTDQYGNAGRYPSVGVSNFTVDGTLQFNQTSIELNLSEKQTLTIQIELTNPSSIPINATLNKTKTWTTIQSSQYLNPLQTATINITLTPDDNSVGDWQANETITAHGSALTTLTIIMNVAHIVGDGECDSGEGCGTADCPACSSSSGGGSSSSGGGGGTLPPVIHECENNTVCLKSQICENYKCIDIVCDSCEYIKDRICKKYECCTDTDCNEGTSCQDHKCKTIDDKPGKAAEDLNEAAKRAIEEARLAIHQNRFGIDIQEAEILLKEAESAYDREHYEIAIERAREARIHALNPPLALPQEDQKISTYWQATVIILILMILTGIIYLKRDTIGMAKRKPTSDLWKKINELEEYLHQVKPIISNLNNKDYDDRLLEIETEKDKAKQMLMENNPLAQDHVDMAIDNLTALKKEIEEQNNQ